MKRGAKYRARTLRFEQVVVRLFFTELLLSSITTESILKLTILLLFGGWLICPNGVRAQDSSSSLGWRVVELGTTAFISHVAYPSRDTAWAAAQSPMISTDSGKSWSEVSTPCATGAAYFVSGSTGFAVIQDSKADFIRTTDAGHQWDTVTSTMPYLSAVDVISPSNLQLAGLSWVGHTTNGGDSWTVKELPVPELREIHFCDSLHGFAVGTVATGPEFTQRGGTGFRTTDAGVTWQQVYTGSQGDLYAVWAVDPLNVYAGGEKGIFASRDSGKSWFLQNPIGGVINAMTFASRLHGIAIGNGGLVMVTYDSGHTWWRQPTPTQAGLYAVAFWNDSLGLIGGVNGTLLRTSTGGNASVVGDPRKNRLELALHPNPAREHTEVSYDMPSSDVTTVSVIDALGRTLLTVQDTRRGTGVQTVNLDTDELLPGGYFVVVQSALFEGITSLTITR
jgi:photosystem II stability/assembly factor-like uncharacterized protein